MRPKARIFPDRAQLYRSAAGRWAELARAATAARGAFHVALSGGSTPREVYETLARPPFSRDVDWSAVHVYFGDERSVPPTDPGSNYRMAEEALLRHVPIPRPQVHAIPADLAYIRQGAHRYAELLAAQLPRAADGAPQFDLMMLGLGEDGHVASLFPRSCALRERERPAVAVYAARLQTWRVTLTLPVIDHACHLMLVVAGERKADIVRRAWADGGNDAGLPVRRLAPRGEVEWFLDAAAARSLPAGLAS